MSGPFESVPTRHLGAFVAVTVLMSWGLSLLTITESVPRGIVVLIMLTPAIATIVLRRRQGQSIVRTVRSSLRGSTASSLRFGLVFPLVFIALAAVLALATGLGTYQPNPLNDVRHVFALSNLPLLPVLFLVQAAVVYGEELGWRGYLLPALTETHGRTIATTLVGVVWALYHVPVLYLGATATGLGDPLFVAAVQAGVVFTFSFPYAYCYYFSNHSVVPVVLFHSLWNILNPWVLGDVYSNAQGFVAGRVILVSGEGAVGLGLGAVVMVAVLTRFTGERSSD